MAVGQLRTVGVDCLKPAPLAEFWSALLGLTVRFADAEWVALEPLGPWGNEFCLVLAPGSTGP